MKLVGISKTWLSVVVASSTRRLPLVALPKDNRLEQISLNQNDCITHLDLPLATPQTT